MVTPRLTHPSANANSRRNFFRLMAGAAAAPLAKPLAALVPEVPVRLADLPVVRFTVKYAYFTEPYPKWSLDKEPA